ncbi:MAG: hypothetical protein C0614_06960 [Desulfuromonas sp.]|nr:MAG: hypothetical protein C0614_06960 [Desulfuromonas sp.]
MSQAAAQTISLPPGSQSALTQALPPLREELSLHPGPKAADGSPTWTLQDPVNNRFYRIGWLEFEILRRWPMAEPERIVASLNESTPLRIDGEEIDQLIEFLASHDLLQIRGPQAIQRLLSKRAARRVDWLLLVLKNYLFFRIPLIRPDRFIEATASMVAPFWSPVAMGLYSASALLGLVLVLRQWDLFVTTFTDFFTLEGAVLMGLTLGGVKILHEFGHAYTAKRYGCRIPSMGIAFMVLWPVLFTDASDAWKLPSRRQRLAIAAGGIGVELAIASLALLAWSFLPPGILRSLSFLLATSTWIVTLMINLNPFMRFDGYYLLADSLGIANLQDRAFALGRWFLREQLFSFADPPPEDFPPKQRLLLISYAFGTWLYRFFLFLGIAVMVYYLFFKLLGIFLMLVEIVWFIGRPIGNELAAWYGRRGEMTLNPRSLRTLFGLALLLALLCFPWQGNLSAQALWKVANYARIYTPSPGQLAQMTAALDHEIVQGEELFALHSPDLDYEIARGEQRIATLSWAVSSQGLDPRLRERLTVTRQELQSELSAQQARLAERKQLTITSPLSGRIVELMSPLDVGDWLSEDELLAVVVGPGGSLIEAFVAEEDLALLEVGSTGRFYPNDPGQAPFSVRLREIDSTSSRRLAEPYLASIYGGGIPVRVDEKGALVPETPIYRVVLEQSVPQPPPRYIVPGVVRLKGARQSLLSSIARNILAVLIRESGF